MRETVLQFGGGIFLRAFAEDFIQTLHDKGLYGGGVVIVQPLPTGPHERINAQNGAYHLALRGLVQGKPVERVKRITVVTRSVHPYADPQAYLALADHPDLRIILSNTTEKGIAYAPQDRLEDRPPASFPAKLAQLLYRRWRNGLDGFLVLPCELIENNADALLGCVRRYARAWGLEAGFLTWLETRNHFCNTLVDRIATGFPTAEAEDWARRLGGPDPLLDVAEPYHLWAIQGDHEAELPLRKAGLNVIWAKDISPYRIRKLRLLNGAHTALAPVGMLAGLHSVGDCLRDEAVSAYLTHTLEGEILPTLEGGAEDAAFAGEVLQRFANPYVVHPLADIARNQAEKYALRVLPSLRAYRQKFGKYPQGLTAALAAQLTLWPEAIPKGLPQEPAFASELARRRELIAQRGIREAILC